MRKSIQRSIAHTQYENTGMMPQEEMLEIGEIRRQLKIGIPKEIGKYESRIILTPRTVKSLVNSEHEILIEKGAGEKSFWSDGDYRKAGARICSKEEIYKSEIVIKVSPFSLSETNLLSGGQTLLSALHSNTQTIENIRMMQRKKVTAAAFELIKDENGFYPFVHSMSEIAGILAITTAGEYLSNSQNGKGMLLGGITGIRPAEIVVLGAGTAAEFAVRSAIGLGASVKVFAETVAELTAIQRNIGLHFSTSVFNKSVLERDLKHADAVISALEFTGSAPPLKVSEKMVEKMKNSSVIIDLNTDNVSCFSTSKITNFGDPAYEKHGVIHYCVPNISSKVARTASISLSNAIEPIIQKISEQQETSRIIKSHPAFKNGTYIYNGILTNKHLGDKFNLDYKDINLLTAIF